MKNLNFRLINVESIKAAHYYEYAIDYQFEGERHNWWEMVYIDRGKVNIISDEETLVLSEGEAWFHRPNEFHAIGSDKETASNVLIISFVCNSLVMKNVAKKKIKIFPYYTKYINSLMNVARDTYRMSRKKDGYHIQLKNNYRLSGPQLMRSYLELMLIMMVRNFIADEEQKADLYSDFNNKYVVSIIEILKENIHNKIFEKDVYKQFDVSTTYLSRVFKEQTGLTVNEYYHTIKVNEAKKLIRQGEYNISQISYMLGYDSPQYFSKVFKKISGNLPKEYMSF